MPASLVRNLITGGAGFVGLHLVDRLIAGDEVVICLDNYIHRPQAEHQPVDQTPPL